MKNINSEIEQDMHHTRRGRWVTTRSILVFIRRHNRTIFLNPTIIIYVDLLNMNYIWWGRVRLLSQTKIKITLFVRVVEDHRATRIVYLQKWPITYKTHLVSLNLVACEIRLIFTLNNIIDRQSGLMWHVYFQNFISSWFVQHQHVLRS